jgi:predicted RNA-binding Zn-ribbon protein involved in translation (DUF1610 family)
MTMSDDRDMSEALHLDGNGIDGLLAEAFSAEPSMMMHRCDSCGENHAMGEHRAYRGVGWVLRCPNCGDAAIIIGMQEERLTVRTQGIYTMARAPSR